MNKASPSGTGSPVVFTLNGIRQGFIKCIPLGIGVFAYGLVFGMLAVQAGMTVFQAQFMSLAVFAGASQLMALDLWSAELPVLTLVLTTFVVNLRHILMGASLRDWMIRIGPLRSYFSLFFMTDESWAVSVKEMGTGKKDAAFLLGAGLCIYFFWNFSTFLGFIMSYWVETYVADPSVLGLDFAFTAVFIALLTFFWKGPAQVPAWLTAGITAWITFLLLPGKWYIVLGGLAGGLAGAWKDAGK